MEKPLNKWLKLLLGLGVISGAYLADHYFPVAPWAIRAEPTSTIALIAAWVTVVSAAAGVVMGIYSLAKKGPVTDTGKQDLKLTTSRYGESIPRGYGLFAVGSKIIWRGLYQEYIVSQSSGKRRDPSTLRHQYYVPYGVLVCENLNHGVSPSQLLGVTNIWLEGKSVYNSDTAGYHTPDGNNPLQIGYPYNPETVVGGGRAFQIFIGLPDQNPWGEYEADGTTQGPSGPLATAYRQKLTMWWDYFALEPYYNRFPTQILVEVKTVDTTVADVIRRECNNVGIQDTELDLSALADILIDGIAIPQSMSAKDVITAVGAAYSCALVEVDGKLRGIKLPQMTRYTVDVNDLAAYLGAVEDTAKKDDARGEAKLPTALTKPARVEVTYLDRARLYESAMQWAGRQVDLYTGSGSADVIRVDLPMTIDTNKANEIAKRILATHWAESETFKFTLPPKYLYLCPGDVLDLPLPGRQTNVRITRMNYGANDVVEIEAVRQVAEAWNQTGVGSTGLYQRAGLGDEMTTLEAPPVEVILPTHLFIWNVVPFVDADDDTDALTFAACRAEIPVPPADNTSYTWQGYQLYRNLAGIAGDGGPGTAEYVAVADVAQEAVIGETVTALPGWTGAFEGIDTTNYVDVKTYGVGVIDAISQQLFDSTRYHGLILVGQEVLQFRDVTAVGTNTFRLSYLRRGLRGTHYLTATHVVAERIWLYDPLAVRRFPINQDEYGKQFAFRAVSHGLAFDTTTPVIYTPGAD